MRFVRASVWISATTLSLSPGLRPASGQVAGAQEAQEAQEAYETQETQQAQTPTAQPERHLRFDLAGLLTDGAVLGGPAQDPVWALTPNPGRVLIQLPFEVVSEGLTEPFTVKNPPVSIRGGRWVAWRVVPEGAAPNHFAGFAGDPFAGAPPFAGGNPAAPSSATAAGDGWKVDPEDPVDPVKAAEDSEAGPTALGLPDGAPQVARSLTVHPDGTLSWSMERAMAGMAVGDGRSDYVLKLRPDRLRDLAPERPGQRSASSRTSVGSATPSTIERSASPRRASGDAAARREARVAEAQAMAAYRDELNAFNAMRQRIKELPDAFGAAPEAGRVYAVFEVSEFAPRIQFTGPAPLPWETNPDDLGRLRDVAAGLNNPSGDHSRALRGALETGEIGQRMAAEAMRLGGYAALLAPGDALIPGLAEVIAGPSAAARNAVVRALSAVPATPVTLKLLTDGLPHMTPQDQLAALAGMLTPGASADEAAQQIIHTARGFMADPSGPPVDAVLQEVARAVLGDTTDEGRRVDEALVEGVGQGLTFRGLPAERQQAAVAAVIGKAPAPLYSAWLGRGLLASTDPALVMQTLEALAQRPLTEPPALIASADHGLLGLLAATDQPTHAKALAVIDRFRIQAENGRRGSSGGALSEDASVLMQQVLEAARAADPVPESLAGFAAAQEPNAWCAETLVRLIMDEPAMPVAAERVIGSGQPIGPVVAELLADDRVRFAERVLNAAEQPAGLGLGLLEEDANGARAARWFADRVAAGEVPTRGDWVRAVGGESVLLGLVQTGSPRVQLAAVDALIASVGGSVGDVAPLLEALADADGDPAETWTDKKRAIFAEQISDAAGPYRLSLNVYDEPYRPTADNPQRSQTQSMTVGPSLGVPDAAVERKPAQAIEIGTVELIVDGEEVRLSNDAVPLRLADERLALNVVSVRDLRFFDLDELMRLPLEEVQDPVALLRTDDGAWAGRFALGPDQTGEWVMTPVENE